MSILVLCDNGCTVTFKKQTVQVNKERKTVLKGYREPSIKLWRFPKDETIPPAVQNVTQRNNASLPEGKMSDTLNFLHRSMGIPTKIPLLNAIRKNNPSTRPFFTENNIAKFLPNSIPQRWGIIIEHGITLNLLNIQHSKPRKVGTSTSTHP